MGLKLEQVVPWGRSLSEYIQIFNLSPTDFKLNILDVAGGPASFNPEMTEQGYSVISCDPIYQFSADEIAQRIQETYPLIRDGLKANKNLYVWRNISSPEELCQIRMSAMAKFLADFPQGLEENRYINAILPHLPFQKLAFDLALCSHFLFLYSDKFSAEFHLTAITEMCRVAQEVRIFPLVDLSGQPSPYVSVVMDHFKQQGYFVEIQPSNYEFQKGGNQILSIHQH